MSGQSRSVKRWWLLLLLLEEETGPCSCSGGVTLAKAQAHKWNRAHSENGDASSGAEKGHHRVPLKGQED